MLVTKSEGIVLLLSAHGENKIPLPHLRELPLGSLIPFDISEHRIADKTSLIGVTRSLSQEVEPWGGDLATLHV